MKVMLSQANAVRIPLPDRSVHCVVTSPPYWGLRDYGLPGTTWPSVTYAPLPGMEPVTAAAWRGCYGLEPTIDLYVAHTVLVFREVARVLRDDGVLFANWGDSYIGGGYGGWENGETGRGLRALPGQKCHGKNKRRPPPGLKAKDMAGIPWRIALALQADGWYLRSDIVWHKTNPMPESVTDRPTKAHEYLFLLTKSPRYYYDADAIREPLAAKTYTTYGGTRGDYQNDPLGKVKASNFCRGTMERKPRLNADGEIAGRNKRTVWSIASEPWSGAHYATYPTALVDPCIRAGTSERGCCPTCGAQWERVTDKRRTFESGSGRAGNLPTGKNGPSLQGGGNTGDIRRGPVVHSTTTGWRPTCDHDAPPVPCLVLDPFAGSGTTLQVARALGRRSVGLDLSHSYLSEQARARLELDRLEEWENGIDGEGEPLEELPLFEGMQ